MTREYDLVEAVDRLGPKLGFRTSTMDMVVSKLRPITAEEEFQTEHFKSEHVQQEFTTYLKENFVKLGGNPDGTVPVVKCLVDDDLQEWPSGKEYDWAL